MIVALLLLTGLQGTPCAGMPLRAGARWRYQAAVSWTEPGAAAARDTTLSWVTRILEVGGADSTIVARVERWPSGLAWWSPDRAADTTLLVCVGQRLYHLAEPAGAAALTPEGIRALAAALRVDELVLQLPLHAGELYGQDPPDRGDTFYGWYVESADPMPGDLVRLGADTADSVYSIIYRTMPDHQVLRFAPGLGLVGYLYEHHGTVATATATLREAVIPR